MSKKKNKNKISGIVYAYIFWLVILIIIMYFLIPTIYYFSYSEKVHYDVEKGYSRRNFYYQYKGENYRCEINNTVSGSENDKEEYIYIDPSFPESCATKDMVLINSFIQICVLSIVFFSSIVPISRKLIHELKNSST